MVSGVASSVNTPAASWLNNACGQVVQEFIQHGAHRMSADMRVLLLHIKRRTLDFGKTSEQVSLRQLCDGLIDGNGVVIAGGLYVGESKARTLLNRAITEGWLVAVNRKNNAGGDAARAFSLNLSKFANEIGDQMDELVNRLRSTARAVATGYDRISEYMKTRTYTVKERLRKAVNARFYSRSRAEETEGNSDMAHLKLPRRMRNSGGLDSEPRGFENHTPNIPTIVGKDVKEKEAIASFLPASRSGRKGPNLQSAAKAYDTVAQATARIADRAATRKQTASTLSDPAKATIQQVQAVADEVSREFGYPRFVFNIKAVGLLKKNAKTQGVEDLRDFIRFAFMNWADISGRHRYGLRKAITEGGKVRATEMPNSPDGWVLATRLPYFMRFYRDHLVGAYQQAERKIAREHADELQQQLAKRDRHILALQQDNADLRERARRTSTEQRQQRGPLRPFGYRGRDDDDSADQSDE